MIAVWGCLLCLLADLFDRFERRFAIDIDRGEYLPDRWVSWGYVTECSRVITRYFQLRLPGVSWEYCPCNDAYGWGRPVLLRRFGKWVFFYTFDSAQFLQQGYC